MPVRAPSEALAAVVLGEPHSSVEGYIACWHDHLSHAALRSDLSCPSGVVDFIESVAAAVPRAPIHMLEPVIKAYGGTPPPSQSPGEHLMVLAGSFLRSSVLL